MKQFKVLMVGPMGVGKTSMLASMSDSWRTAVNKLQYQTKIDSKLLIKLKELEESPQKNDIVGKNMPMIEGTHQTEVFNLSLLTQNDVEDISVQFIDVPGGYYIPSTASHSNTNYEEVRAFLQGSISSLWCVDCVSMLEGKNDPNYNYHESRNEPKLIAELYKNLDTLPQNHRIIFVLMRAETYLYDRDNNDEWLLSKFDEFYGQYIAEIQQRFHNVEIYVTPVQTLGCFKFNRYKKNPKTNELEAVYIKYKNEYAPDNCETPALLVIDRALQCAITEYELKKQENLNNYKIKASNPFKPLFTYLTRSILGGDKDEYYRAYLIYQLLKDGKEIDSEDFAKDFEVNSDLNAHIIVERLKKAAEKMEKMIDEKRMNNRIHQL